MRKVVMNESLKRVVLTVLTDDKGEPQQTARYDPHEFMRIERATPSYLSYHLLFWKLYAVAWTAGVIAASVALLLIDTWLLIVVIPLVGIAAFKAATLYVTTRLDYELRWYVITDRSLLIREGVWNVREITLTFANAQNVRITQGPLQRYFGFSNVEIDTAGGGGASKEEKGSQRHQAALRGLANPTEVRDLILDLLRRYRTTGLGDPDDREHRTSGELNPSLVMEIWEEAKGLRKAVKNEVNVSAEGNGNRLTS
jgi:membrane protein YdbS with pleckstrin-like domain